MKKWTAVEYDLSKTINDQAKPQHVDIKPGMKLQLIIELDDSVYSRLSKDPSWLQKMQTKANDKSKESISKIVQQVKVTDQKAANFNPQQATIFSKDLATTVQKEMEAGGKAMATEVDKLFEDYKKGQSDLMKFRIKSGGKIVLSSLSVVASSAAAAASHGAATPLAIVSIMRSVVTISQECTKLALSADQFAKIIQGEIKTLALFMNQNMEKAKAKDKVLQSAKEIGLNMISGALGIETPSLKNCDEHIKVHKVDIAKLEAKSHDLSKQIHGAMDVEENWRKKFDVAKKTLPSDKVGKVVVHKEKVEKALHALIESTIKVNQAIERAEVRQGKFEKTLESMKKGVPEWTGYAKEATALAVDLALGMGEVEKVVETVLHVCIESEKAIG
ncbi:MAG TPA: hypothetical protein VFA15_00300, partial [Nitrososphaera sp.]|nr:hypothetical protein [Nitrososphaera sp.]